jgi:hypothetical protein
MKKVYYLDLPDPKSDGLNDTWINIGIYSSRKKAIEKLKTTWGIASIYADLFISEGEG